MRVSQRLQISGSRPPMSGYDVCCVSEYNTPMTLSHENSLELRSTFSDIDECVQTPNPCAYQCRNVPGSFRCLCPPGTVLLGDGRSCAGLERGQTFTNGTRVRARLRPQLVSSLGRPILSRTHGVSRITRQSCPVGYTNRDGTCVGECASKLHFLKVDHLESHTFLYSVQMWTSVCSGSRVNTSAETPSAVSSACVPPVTNSYPTAGAVKVRLSTQL